MTEIPNHILFSEMKEIRKREDLREMIYRVLKQGLEGLVLKDVNVSNTAVAISDSEVEILFMLCTF